MVIRSIAGLLCATLLLVTAACGGAEAPSNSSSAEVVGGADCPNPGAPNVEYLSRDPKECMAMLFECKEGYRSFGDACGCGCVGEVPPEAPTDAGPGKQYVAYGKTCLVVLFECKEGTQYFSDDVGCGCEPK